MKLTDETLLAKLRARPSKGPVKLSYAEADYLIDLIENPRLNREALRVLVDQAKRKRLREPGVNAADPDGTRHARPPAPVLDVHLVDPVREEPQARVGGWRGNPMCGGAEAAAA